jgi:hypothetical protein
VVARATPPPTTVVDGTGAGDCFTRRSPSPCSTVAPTRTRCATPARPAPGCVPSGRPAALPWAAELEG